MYMNVLIDLISREVSGAFSKAGFDPAYGKVTLSNRPDLCEYQCNGALPAAKVYHKAPIQIANAVKEQLAGCEMFESVEAVNPGFLNFKLSAEFLASYVAEMNLAEHFGVQHLPAKICCRADRRYIVYTGMIIQKQVPQLV